MNVLLRVLDRVTKPPLLAVLAAVLERAGLAGQYDLAPVARHGTQPILNTRGTRVGTLRAAGVLRFHD